MQNLVTISGVTGYTDKNGTAHLKLEDVARGLGFMKREIKGESTYERINKQAIKAWFIEFGIQDSENDLPEFVPENIFYKLCFKANNETARRFQDMVTDEILPSIRKHGVYATDVTIDRILEDPDFGIRLLVQLKEERDKSAALAVENENLSVRLNESEKFWTIMKFNQHFNLRWDMKTCQRNGKAASVYSRQHGYEIRKCATNDDRFKETNSYSFDVLEILFLPQRVVRRAD